MIELCAATILSVFVFAFMEVSRIHEEKIKALEKRLDELAKKTGKNKTIMEINNIKASGDGFVTCHSGFTH